MKDEDPKPPFERLYDLNRLSEAGFEAAIELTPEDRQKLALWANVVSVNSFEARVAMRRLSQNRFAYAARLLANVTQDCTVTLEPVLSNLDLDFTRNLHLVPHVKKVVDISGELSASAGDDDVPEEIESSRYDLAGPLLEEFLLAIDPYPRAPGVAFEAPSEDADKPPGPFAVLGKLKETR